MYRAAALLIDRAGIDLGDEGELERFCGGISIRLESALGKQVVIANGSDVTDSIRTPEMSLLTSRISAFGPVREALMESQRLMGIRGGVVLEGRDIGTVVFPDAELKFFLSASPEERGRRRFEELTSKGEPVTLEDTVADVIRRDRQDSVRELAPLRKADDAVSIDSSGMGIEDVLATMMEHINKRTVTRGKPL